MKRLSPFRASTVSSWSLWSSPSLPERDCCSDRELYSSLLSPSRPRLPSPNGVKPRGHTRPDKYRPDLSLSRVCKCDACKSPRESSRPFFLSNVTECTPAAASSEAGGMGGGGRDPLTRVCATRNARIIRWQVAAERTAHDARLNGRFHVAHLLVYFFFSLPCPTAAEAVHQVARLSAELILACGSRRDIVAQSVNASSTPPSIPRRFAALPLPTAYIRVTN